MTPAPTIGISTPTPATGSGSSTPPPNNLPNETQNEYFERVAGHEGTHGINDAYERWSVFKHNIDLRPTDTRTWNLDLERLPNNNERNIIRNQGGRRTPPVLIR